MEIEENKVSPTIRHVDPNSSHLGWLVESRAENQRVALDIYKLFEAYLAKMRSKEFSQIAHDLVATSFSLWRAAFLADKTGKKEAVFQDAKTFLGKMLLDNTITYTQDRAAREWTFNYYMWNAIDCLLRLAKTWPIVKITFDKAKKLPKETYSQHRWRRRHLALEKAVQNLKRELED